MYTRYVINGGVLINRKPSYLIEFDKQANSLKEIINPLDIPDLNKIEIKLANLIWRLGR